MNAGRDAEASIDRFRAIVDGLPGRELETEPRGAFLLDGHWEAGLEWGRVVPSGK